MSKSPQEVPNSRSWYRGGPKDSQLLTLATSTDSLTKSSRMSIDTSNCWSILFLPNRRIKGFNKTSCCRSSTTLDDRWMQGQESNTNSLRLSAHPCRVLRRSRQAGRPAASSPPGDLHQRPLHRWWWPRKPSFPCSNIYYILLYFFILVVKREWLPFRARFCNIPILSTALLQLISVILKVINKWLANFVRCKQFVVNFVLKFTLIIQCLLIDLCVQIQYK